MDQITITDLQVFGHHGVFPEENALGQKFLVSAVLYTNTREAGKTDDLTKSIHYGLVCQDIMKLMQEHTFALLEGIAEFVSEELLKKYEHMEAIDLTIKKPWAPILLPLETVSVTIHRAWHRAFIALGSNIGDKKAYLDGAVEAFEKRDDVKVIKNAAYQTTAPYGMVEQDDFLNGCMEIYTLLTPEELLGLCQELEIAAKRERVIHWGPRTLDLDIIFYDDNIIDSERLTIPHAEMEKRLFVLDPLCELAPYYRHPVLNKTVRELKERLENKGE